MHLRTTVFAALALSAGGLAAGVAACATGASPQAQTGTDASTTQEGSTPTPDSSSGGGGCDANTQTDYLNCGSCGHVCPTGQVCNAGQCQNNCTAPQTLCPGEVGCFDLTGDLQNCGGCGNQCPAPPAGVVTGVPECTSSTCDFTCPADAGAEAGPVTVVKCAADSGTPGCFDLTASSDHCGSCGTPCAAGDTCTSSTCCPIGSVVCGGACTNVQTSATNCGACDAGCPAPAQCAAGVCTGYAATNPTVPFINACSLPGQKTTLVNKTSWTNTVALPLPFTFNFFGTPETQIWLQSQGAVGFGAPGTGINAPDGYPDCQFFDPYNLYAAVVVFGDTSLATSGSGVCYATLGGSGDGGADAGAPAQFVVTWSNATELDDPGSSMTFSLVLTEGTNTLDFMYQTLIGGTDGGLDPTVAGANATVGLQADKATAHAAYSCNTTFIPSTPFDIHFAPAQ